MNKKSIKSIAKRCFNAGKEDLADRLFNEYFEEFYREAYNKEER